MHFRTRMHKVGLSWLTQFQRQAGEWRCFVEAEKLQKHVFFVKYKPHSPSLRQQWTISLSSLCIFQSNLESKIRNWLIPWKKYKKGYILASEMKRLCTLCCCQIYSLWNLFSIWSVSVIYFSELLVEVLLMEMEREEWLLRVNCSISLCCQLSYSYISVKEEATETQNWKYFWV